MEFLAIRSPLAVSTVVRRRTLTANTSQLFLSGFGETTNYRDHVRRAKSLVLRILQPAVQQNISQAPNTIKASRTNPPRRNARLPPRNRQVRRRPEHPPESNTRFYLNLICITFLQQGGANWVKFVRELFVVREFHSSVGSQKLQGRGSGENIVPIIVEAVPVAQ